MSYLRNVASARRTPQWEPIPDAGQIPNSAGGYGWGVDSLTRLRRFCLLGSERGSYYASEHDLTRENVDGVRAAIAEHGIAAVAEIVAISEGGRAPKQDPAIYALALAASAKDEATRKAALDALLRVCRTGTALFNFNAYVEEHRGRGPALNGAVRRWYNRESVDDVAYQMVKYRQRNGWSHRDLLRLAKPVPPTPAHSLLYGWATGKLPQGGSWFPYDGLPDVVRACEQAQASESPKATATLIREYAGLLPREALKTEHLTDPDVWRALLDTGMPMTAMLRNLATMTRIGVLAPMGEHMQLVTSTLTDGEKLRKARVHPIAILAALLTYASGHSARGDSSWTPLREIMDALDAAFYASFGNVEPSGKRTLLALDVSGSMGYSEIAGVPGLTPRVGAAAMALVTAATEPNHFTLAFSHQLVPITLSPRQRLDDVLKATDALPFGGTDCALPMVWAAHNQSVPVDTFVVLTDSETWAGDRGHGHPSQALQAYREKSGINARLVVVGMTANRFTIADPRDAGMMDVVGFDTATPDLISAFSRGEF